MKANKYLTETQFALFNLLSEAFQKDNDEEDVTLIATTEKSTDTMKPVIAIKKGDQLLPVALLLDPTVDMDKYVPIKGSGYTDKDPKEQGRDLLQEILEGLANRATTVIDEIEQVKLAGKIGILIRGTTTMPSGDRADVLSQLLAAMQKKQNGTGNH
jgi:hypothetical protein